MAKKEEPDLVPYYRPGTTEPEMVPRSSVPGAEVVQDAESVLEETEVSGDKEEAGASKKAAKKVARKK